MARTKIGNNIKRKKKKTNDVVDIRMKTHVFEGKMMMDDDADENENDDDSDLIVV